MLTGFVLAMTEPEELSPEEQELLDQALSNLQSFIKDNTTHYVFVDDAEDPRNEEDYDTFEYGTEPLPHDTTWVQKRADCQ